MVKICVKYVHKLNFFFFNTFVQLFINNNWYDGKNGKTYNKLNSFNGKMICNFVEGDKVNQIIVFIFFLSLT